MQTSRALLVGESAVYLSIELWGFDTLSSGRYHASVDHLREAVHEYGVEIVHIPNHRAISDFPDTHDALREFDVVILSDVSANTLLLDDTAFVQSRPSINRLRLVADYVRAGGGFLMIGGYMSFSGRLGAAGYHLTPIAELLPVRMLGYDDRVEAPEGLIPVMVDSGHDIVRGLPQPMPPMLGYNMVERRDGALVLSIAGDPLLVVDSVGAGRVGAFTSDCVGHWGSQEFMSWPAYGMFWAQLIHWLARTTTMTDAT